MTDEPVQPSILVGRRIAEARIKAGLNEAELGQFIGVSGPRISHFECGYTIPRHEYRSIMAEALHVKSKWLFAELKDDPPETGRQLPRQRHAEVKMATKIPSKPQLDIAKQINRLLNDMDHKRLFLALAVIRTLSRTSIK